MVPLSQEYPELAKETPSTVARIAKNVRRSEWVLWAFLVYTAILAAVAPLPPDIRVRTIGLNVLLLAGYWHLISREIVEPRTCLTIARDWLPLSLTLLAYWEMGWFALPQATHTLEAGWVTWDRIVLRGGARAVIECFGPLLPAMLELAYLLVYALGPFAVAMLYAYGRRDRVDSFLFLFLVGVLLCYAQFPFWPSGPPRTLFPTEDLPAYSTIFRRLNLWLLGVGGIHTSVFPSAHVAAAFSAAAGMRLFLPEHKWVGRTLGVIAVLIALGTVYGRYHYLADVAAGLLMAGIASLLAYLNRSHREIAAEEKTICNEAVAGIESHLSTQTAYSKHATLDRGIGRNPFR
jgi:membrane-associated phospholipid phosphatase